MKQKYFKLFLSLLILVGFTLLGYSYLHRINFYNPIKISVVSDEKLTETKIVATGITPLGKRHIMPFDNTGKTYLFNEVLLTVDTNEIQKIHSILIYHGADSVVLNRQILRNQKKEIRLSEYNSYQDNTGEKYGAVTRSWTTYILDKYIRDFFYYLLRVFSPLWFYLPILSFFLFCLFIPKRFWIIPSLKFSKNIFYFSLCFFLLLQVYGVWYYQFRMQTDASPLDLLYYSSNNSEILMIPLNRFAYILNKLLIRPAFLLGVPWSWVGRIYCFNDALFYILLAVAIIYFTSKYEYAAVVLAAPVLIYGYGFYTLLCCELFLSGALMVLYSASIDIVGRRKRNIILILSMFFIIWSQTISLMLLFFYLPFLYKTKELIRRDKWILLSFLVGIVIRLCFLPAYDLEKVNGIVGNISSNDLHATSYLEHIVVTYMKTYWHIVIIFVMTVYGLWKRKVYIKVFSLFFIGAVSLYLCIVNNEDFIKYMYPFHLILLLEGFLLVSKYYKSTKSNYLYLLFIFIGGLHSIVGTNHDDFNKDTQRINKIVSYLYEKDSRHSKWFLSSNDELDLAHLDDVSLIFSAFQNLPTAVIIKTYDLDKIKSVGHDEILLPPSIGKIGINYGSTRIYEGQSQNEIITTLSIDELNINDGKTKIYEGPYRELKIDSLLWLVRDDPY